MVQANQFVQILKTTPPEVAQELNSEVIPGIAQKEDAFIRNFINRKSRIVLENGQTIILDVFQRNLEFILQAIANFKKTRAIKKTVVPMSIASIDTIFIETLDRPSLFNLATFKKTGLTPNSVFNVIDDGAGNPFQLDAQSRERIILLGFIDLLPGSGITGIQVIDDGDQNKRGENTGYQFEYPSSAQIYELELPRVIDKNVLVKARITDGTSAWLVPIGIHIADGALLPTNPV